MHGLGVMEGCIDGGRHILNTILLTVTNLL